MCKFILLKLQSNQKMKITNILVLFFLPVFVFGQASFDKANELYQQEKFEEAAQVYEQILANGEHSVGLYYNLGNAYYKLNQVAPAIYNYEKALLLDPNNHDVKNNLTFARNMTIDEIKEVPKVGFTHWLSGFTSVFHYDTWAKIAVGFSFLLLFCFIGYYFSRKITFKRIMFSVMIVFLVLSVLSIVIAVFEKNQAQNNNPAIVFAESAFIKGEPKENSSSIAVIHEGNKVYVLESVDAYYKVELLNGSQGWVIKSAIKTLK